MHVILVECFFLKTKLISVLTRLSQDWKPFSSNSSSNLLIQFDNATAQWLFISDKSPDLFFNTGTIVVFINAAGK